MPSPAGLAVEGRHACRHGEWKRAEKVQIMTQQCIGTPLSEEEISAAIDDVAPASVVEHIARCSFCRRRFEQAARTDAQLYGRLARFQCPDPFVLNDYQFGLLSPAEAEQVGAHLANCPRCTAELATYDTLDTPALEPVQHQQPVRQAGILARLREEVAHLVTPGLPPVFARGMRGDEGAHTVIYKGYGLQVSLTPTLVSELAHMTIEGLIYPDSDVKMNLTGALVQLFQDQMHVRSTFVDEYNVFSFIIPNAGSYILYIYIDGQRIRIDLDL
jgi:hypothetical protein